MAERGEACFFFVRKPPLCCVSHDVQKVKIIEVERGGKERGDGENRRDDGRKRSRGKINVVKIYHFLSSCTVSEVVYRQTGENESTD